MKNVYLLISIILRLLVPVFFTSVSYADMADDYPEWESCSAELHLLAKSADSGIVKGIRTGQFIRIFDDAGNSFAYNGYGTSGFSIFAEDSCFSEEGYILTGIKPGFTVEVYPDSAAVSYQDADIFRWRDVFLPCDISAEEESFSVSPSTALDGSYNGSVSVSPETAGENIYHLEVLTETGETLSGENSVGGLAPGTYKVRIAPSGTVLASGWYEFIVPGPAVYPISFNDVSEEAGSMEVFHIVSEASPSEVHLSSGSVLYGGETVYVRVATAEGYELSGLDLTIENGTRIRLLPEEAEEGVFSFAMPDSSLAVSALLVPIQVPDPPSGEDPSDDGDDEEDIVAVVFSPNEATASLSEGKQLYYYTLIPDDTGVTLIWKCDFPEIADLKIDTVQKMILMTPKKVGSVALTVAVKGHEEQSNTLVINIVDDKAEYPEPFDSCYFTYATEEGVWFYDLPGDFSLRCSAPGLMLDKILVDGYYVPQYSAGSLNWSLSDTSDTSVNFSRKFMASLSRGDHTFMFVYTNGISASKSIHIQSRYSPAITGDERDIYLYYWLILFSAATITAILRKIRKESTGDSC